LEKIKKYIDENNKKPSTIDKNKEIKQMANWIGTQQKNYDKEQFIMKNKEIRKRWEQFVEKYNEYFKSNEEIWNEKLEKVIQYINENHKKPSTIDKNKEIKQMANWIGTQQKNYDKEQQIMENKEIRKRWEQFVEEYNGYFKSNEEWNEMLKNINIYIEKNNKIPNRKNNDKKVKQMQYWIDHQNRNFSKREDIMKYDEKRMEWKNFITKNSKIFRKNKIINEILNG
jgi:hypothetical protein